MGPAKAAPGDQAAACPPLTREIPGRILGLCSKEGIPGRRMTCPHCSTATPVRIRRGREDAGCMARAEWEVGRPAAVLWGRRARRPPGI